VSQLFTKFKNLFRNDRVTRPVPTPIPAANVQFGATTIQVAPATFVDTGGNYATTVIQHLAEIESFPVGQQLIQALTATGKRQLIVYAGPNSNQAAGSAAGYKKLRRFHDGLEREQFAQELRATMTRAGHGSRWLASRLHLKGLPRWSGATDPSPFAARNMDEIEAEINTWRDGSVLPNNDKMDVLMLVLEEWLANGPGVGTRINYDPHKVLVGGTERPAHVGLFHELMHGYYNALGGQLGREDSASEDNGGRLFELMAVGLPPFNERPFSENQFRTAIGWPFPRTQYP
jgi:hypothetical protein